MRLCHEGTYGHSVSASTSPPDSDPARLPATLGELRASGHVQRSVKAELRENRVGGLGLVGDDQKQVHEIDRKFVDGFVTGHGRIVAGGAEILRGTQTGYVRNYGATFLLGVVVVVSALLVRVIF